MLINDLFPDLAKQLVRDLRKLKRTDLAEQVMNLRIVDRCRCGSEPCGTFYTQETESRQRMAKHATDIMLKCGAILTEAQGRIVEIQTLDPQVDDVLRQVIP
jgi:hypothetical protein